MTEEEFEFQEATRRGRARLDALPKASSAKYNKASKRLILNLTNGVTLFVPVDLIQGLQTDSAEALSDFDLVSEGSQIHWHTLDVQFYVKSLLEGVFGTPKWMDNLKTHYAKIGAKGGASQSEAKKLSSRENGKKGGRPRNQRIA